MQFTSAPPLLDIKAADENGVIRLTAGQLAGSPDVLDYEGFLSAVFERQRINPPVLGNGVAIPHARTASVKEMVCAVARCAEAIPFGEERIPVRLVFLFGVPPHRIDLYLATMAALVKRLRKPEVIEGLLAATQAEEFLGWLEK